MSSMGTTIVIHCCILPHKWIVVHIRGRDVKQPHIWGEPFACLEGKLPEPTLKTH